MPAPTFLQALRRNAHVVVTQERIAAGRAAADDTETWHYVGAAGEVGFENAGWINTGVDTPVRFRMDRSGFVHLQGVPHAYTPPDGIIFRLPNSWAPDALTVFPVLRSGLNPGEMIGLYVHADGRVEVSPAPSNEDIYLDNYRWKGKTL